MNKFLFLIFVAVLNSCTSSIEQDYKVNNEMVSIKSHKNLDKKCQKRNSGYKENVSKAIEPFHPIYIRPTIEKPLNSIENMKKRDEQRNLPDSLKEILNSKTITCNFNDESLENVIHSINNLSNTKILLDPDIDKNKKVTLILKDANFRGTLEIILALTTLDYAFKNNTLVITEYNKK